MELADTADSKSAARNGVGVRVPPDAPILHESASGKLAVCKTAIAGPIPASCSKFGCPDVRVGSTSERLIPAQPAEELPATSRHRAVEDAGRASVRVRLTAVIQGQ